jgi:hypothetical protein
VTPLAEVPFPLGLEGVPELPFLRKALRNCWNSLGNIIQRPGLTLRGTNSRVARGSFEWNGGLYAVASQDLIKITNVLTGAFTVIGTVAGTADIRTTNDFVNTVIVVKGGAIYTLSKTDVLIDISANSNILPSNSLTTLNSRTIYIPSDGSPAFFSDVNAAGLVQDSSFFDAEQLPDNNTEVFQLNNILYIAGTDSIQSYLDRGLNPVPYVPQTNRIDVGVIGGVIEAQDETTGRSGIFFIGNKKDQIPGMFLLVPGAAPKVSNSAIDEILAKYPRDQLAQAIPGRYVWKSNDVITFTLTSDSFGFHAGNWHGLDTWVNGANVPWQVGYIQEFDLEYYSFFAGNFNLLDDVNKDSGESFIRIIDDGIELGGSFRFQSLQYHISQGYNAAIGSVFLAMSDDNVLYPTYVAAKTGAIGNYGVKLDWNYPGGLGLYDIFMGYRLQTGEDVNFSGTKLFIE